MVLRNKLLVTTYLWTTEWSSAILHVQNTSNSELFVRKLSEKSDNLLLQKAIFWFQSIKLRQSF